MFFGILSKLKTSVNMAAPPPTQNVNVKSDIAKVLEGMSTSQLYEIMVQMKVLPQVNRILTL
jgi:hypothetical protein